MTTSKHNVRALKLEQQLISRIQASLNFVFTPVLLYHAKISSVKNVVIPAV